MVPRGIPTVPSAIGTVLLVGVALAFGTPALAVVWPVYLSLVGLADSPSTYADGVTSGAAVDDLKRQYATGDLSTAEFERRLESPLDSDESDVDRDDRDDRRSVSEADADH